MSLCCSKAYITKKHKWPNKREVLDRRTEYELICAFINSLRLSISTFRRQVFLAKRWGVQVSPVVGPVLLFLRGAAEVMHTPGAYCGALHCHVERHWGVPIDNILTTALWRCWVLSAPGCARWLWLGTLEFTQCTPLWDPVQELQKIADLKTAFVSELSSHGQNCTLVIESSLFSFSKSCFWVNFWAFLGNLFFFCFKLSRMPANSGRKASSKLGGPWAPHPWFHWHVWGHLFCSYSPTLDLEKTNDFHCRHGILQTEQRRALQQGPRVPCFKILKGLVAHLVSKLHWFALQVEICGLSGSPGSCSQEPILADGWYARAQRCPKGSRPSATFMTASWWVMLMRYQILTMR